MYENIFECVDCIEVYVDNLEAGIAYYRDAMGLKLLWKNETSVGFGLKNDITELVINTERRGVCVDIKVASVEEVVPRIITAGGALETPVFDIPIGKCAVVKDAWGNRYVILDMTKGKYVTDSDGNILGLSLDEASPKVENTGFTVRAETEDDYKTVENITREAFWNVYKPGCDEHYFVHTMRSHQDFVPELAFVLEKDGEIIGNVMYTKSHLVAVDGERKEILSMGPICILPKYQRKGGSKMLLEHSFAKAIEMGYDTVVNFGNPGNYVGRGYVNCKRKNITFGNDVYPTALLVKELIPGVLTGKKWQFIPSESENCCEDTEAVAKFDEKFVHKEKAWAPSQEEGYIYSHSCVSF